MMTAAEAIAAIRSPNCSDILVAFTIEVTTHGAPTKAGFVPAARKFILRTLRALEPTAYTSARLLEDGDRPGKTLVIFDEQVNPEAVFERLAAERTSGDETARDRAYVLWSSYGYGERVGDNVAVNEALRTLGLRLPSPV